MNLREGTRRLALLLGGLGAIAGGVLSYVYLQPVMHQREMHKAFEQLANSDVVKEQRKTLQSPDPYASIAKPISPPPSGYAIDPKTGERIAEYDAQGKPITELPPGAILKPTPQHGRAKLSDIAPPPRYKIDPNTGERVEDSGGVLDWSKAVPVSTQVNKGGITTINWGHDYEVASIETSDGETLSPTPAPAAWEYLLVVLFPVAGFVIPWGAVRAIGWVGAGFVASAK
jgi:hypothetical protein